MFLCFRFAFALELKIQPVRTLAVFCTNLLCLKSGADPGFGQGGGAQVLRPKVADKAKRSRMSEASNLRPGSRARLRAVEAFGFLMLKICILPHSRDSFSLIFDIYFNTKS